MKKLSLILFLLISLVDVVYSQGTAQIPSSDVASSTAADVDSVDLLLARTEHVSKDIEKRVEAVQAIAATVEKLGRSVSSISDILSGENTPLPVGIKNDSYALYVNSIETKDDEQNWMEACALITFGDTKQQLAFEGKAVIEGEYGVDTKGCLELIKPCERSLGANSSIIFKEGTTIFFGCEGISSIKAKIAFILKDGNFHGVDAKGKNTGKLCFECEAEFDDFDDFYVSLNVDKRFKIAGVDELTFALHGLTLDQSLSRTPDVVKFPANYFDGASNNLDKQAWRGLAISQATVELSGFFGNVNNKENPKFDLYNAIIDGYGISGSAVVSNILRDSDLNSDEWGMSITDLKIALFKGSIDDLGFGGHLNIPPLGEASKIKYFAEYETSNNTFVFNASLEKKAKFPLFAADLELYPSSNVEVKIDDGHIRPKIRANGRISINAPIEGGNFEVPDILFQDLVIQSEKPYVQLGHFALEGELKTPSFSGFQLSLRDIKSTPDNRLGISFTTEVKINSQFIGSTIISLLGDDEKWRVKDVQINKVAVDFRSDAFSLNGEVEFRRGDAVYGRGFRGDIALSLLKDKYKLKAIGVFGKKDNNRYFLTDAFFEVKPESGIKVPPALTFFGVGGGLYSGMQQQLDGPVDDFGRSLSGICYVPDESVGLGFMASTKFGFIASPALFNAKVGFEMQFNRNWGVNFVSFTGEGKFVSDILGLGDLKSNLQSAIKDKAEKFAGSSIGEKISNATEAELDNILGKEPKLGGALTATVAMKLDIQHDVYTADMHAYLNFGILKGIGQNNEMGWAKAYFANDKWYTYIGTPTKPLGVRLLNIAETKSYFMVGDDVPDIAPPPSEVLEVLKSYDSSISHEKESLKGNGLAFGAAFNQNLKVEVMPFYASLGIGLGADMVLKNYGLSAHCAGINPPLGINGWFASAQAWAYAKADVGLFFKLFHKRKKFSIFNAHAATLLKGQGPNPLYLYGSIGGKFKILGGLVKGRFEIPFSIGEKCDIKGASPFGDMEVIKQLTPSESAEDVDVFIAPQLVLNMAVDEIMKVEDEDNLVNEYKINLDEFSVKSKDGKILPAISSFDSEKRVCTLDLDEPLEGKCDYEVYAKVSFMKRVGGSWRVVTDENGKTPVVEEQRVTFKSGTRPDHILTQHIICSYPADGQCNFYPKEYDKAYLATKTNYGYLFQPANADGDGIPEGFKQVAQIKTKQNSQVKDVNFSYTTGADCGGIAGAKTYIEIPVGSLGLKNDAIYSLSIVNKPLHVASDFENIKATDTKSDAGGDVTLTTNEATSDLAIHETTLICSADFRTSNYSTFMEKMKDFKLTQSYAYKLFSLATGITANIENSSEGTFDMFEYHDSESNLVVVEPDYKSTYWYTTYVAPLFYDNKSVSNIIGKILSPPLNSVTMVTNNESMRMVNLISPELKHYATAVNSSAYAIYCEMSDNREKVSNLVVSKGFTESSELAKFLSSDNIPIMTFGNYPLLFKYILPGKRVVTSTYKLDVEVNK